jgi:hypothetical protein
MQLQFKIWDQNTTKYQFNSTKLWTKKILERKNIFPLRKKPFPTFFGLWVGKGLQVLGLRISSLGTSFGPMIKENQFMDIYL